MSLLLPHILADRYTLRRRIGVGSFAETYLAIDTRTDTKVAVKVLRSGHLGESERLTRFEREATTAAQVAHPNVVSTFDHGRDGDIAYIVMEWIDGPDLKTLMYQQGPLPVDQAVPITQSILAGLSAIHEAGIVHRDIKPQNILIAEDGTAKLTDFGIARCSTDMGLTETGVTIGTAAYMAPEQAIGDEAGPAADLYAVGVVLFEMLTGQLPFPGDVPVRVMYQHVHAPPPRPSAINPDISASLESTILRALAKNPAERFANATEMMSALDGQELSQHLVPNGGHRFPPSWLAWRDDPVRTLGSFASVAAAVLMVLIVSMMVLVSRASEPVSDPVAASVDVMGPSLPVSVSLTSPTATPTPMPEPAPTSEPTPSRDAATTDEIHPEDPQPLVIPEQSVQPAPELVVVEPEVVEEVVEPESEDQEVEQNVTEPDPIIEQSEDPSSQDDQKTEDQKPEKPEKDDKQEKPEKEEKAEKRNKSDDSDSPTQPDQEAEMQASQQETEPAQADGAEYDEKSDNPDASQKSEGAGNKPKKPGR